jgi:hypothetical protein
LKQQAALSSEILVPVYKNAQHHIPEDCDINLKRSDHFASYTVYLLSWEVHFMLLSQGHPANVERYFGVAISGDAEF